MEYAVAIVTIVAYVLSGLMEGYQMTNAIATQGLSGQAQQKARRIINKLVELANKDNKLKEDIMNAYNQKSAKLAARIIYASPVGEMFHDLQRKTNELDEEYREQINNINERQGEYTKLQNDVQAAQSLAGTSMHEWGKADKLMKDTEKKVDSLTAANQATNGGLKENA